MKKLSCACGWEVIGTEDKVVEATMEHAEKIHNMRSTREDVLARMVAADA